ncbi:MAG: cysteine hydrolase, partial [Lachnospiraceae bacterium]|nr:cysteine hydrolase [Lachnospiraceae bacterium]
MVLLVIDTQKGITDDRLFGFRELEENIKTLISAARENKVEVVFVRHDDGPGSGFSKGDQDFEIYDGFAPKEGEKIFDKTVNSALHGSTGLTAYLMSKNIKTIIAVGLQTDFCVDATIKSGFDNGFEMIVPQYCNSTRSNPFMDAKTTYEFFNKNM